MLHTSRTVPQRDPDVLYEPAGQCICSLHAVRPIVLFQHGMLGWTGGMKHVIVCVIQSPDRARCIVDRSLSLLDCFCRPGS